MRCHQEETECVGGGLTLHALLSKAIKNSQDSSAAQ